MPAAWSVVGELDDTASEEVAALLASIAHATEEDALSEAALDALSSGDARHALRREGAVVTGYAVLRDAEVLEAEPALGTFDRSLADLLERKGRASLLLRCVGDADVEALVRRGWRIQRSLHRLRVALPAPPPPASALEPRAFEPGVDELPWVEENNAAFRHHPSQGKMTVERLVAREHASWFDPAGFLLFFADSELVASCWTKVRPTPAGEVGEIYVISVAPTAQGRGLGRLAVLHGLAHLAGKGIGLAELYVEDDNTAAIALYESLGFTYNARVVELRLGP